MLKNFALVLLVMIFSSCSHLGTRGYSETLKHDALSHELNDHLYNTIKNEIINAHATHLKECNCMMAFHRNLLQEPDKSSRYIFDATVGEEALKLSKGRDTVSVLAVGSGMLLNELTAIANIIAHKKNVHIYLTDWAYVFYGDENFADRALDLGKNPDKLPDGYRDFYFWQWARKKEKNWPFLPFFEEHHAAIDEFKQIIAKLDTVYGTTSKVEIIKPVADQKWQMPALDLIISIDAFTDAPNLLSLLHYQAVMKKNPVRFVALNKTRPLGGFWHPDFNKKITDIDRKPLSLDIYDVWSEEGSGKFRMLSHQDIAPIGVQEDAQKLFKSRARKDWTLSPLEFIEQ